MKLDKSSRRQVFVAVLVASILACVAWAVVTLVTRARIEADGLRVYCLAPDRHEDLVNAAEALELAEQGESTGLVKVDDEELTPADWRRGHVDEFDDACAALSAAQRPPTAGVLTMVLPFLTALVGAIAAFVATSWRDRVTRAQVLADDLRAATSGFVRAVEDYLTNVRTDPADTELAVQRVALLTQVSRARATRPGWDEIGHLETVLTSGPFGPSITRNWKRGFDGEAENDARIATLRLELASTRAELFELAHRLERPSRQPSATGGGRS